MHMFEPHRRADNQREKSYVHMFELQRRADNKRDKL